jgi:hypothetical protein
VLNDTKADVLNDTKKYRRGSVLPADTDRVCRFCHPPLSEVGRISIRWIERGELSVAADALLWQFEAESCRVGTKTRNGPLNAPRS